MQPTELLNQVSARPRALRQVPRYPRRVMLLATVWSMSAVGCASASHHPVDPGGVAPYPHDPSSNVHVASPPSRFAQPPPDEVVQPIEDVDDGSDDPQPAGEAPIPYE